jgi:hypothetical protein
MHRIEAVLDRLLYFVLERLELGDQVNQGNAHAGQW